MIPGAPSLTTNRGSGKPRRRMSRKNSRQLAVSLLGARRQVQQRLLAVRQKAPGRQHCLAWLAQMQPLGNAVDKQVDDLELCQLAPGKPFIFGPQPLGDLADRGAAEQAAGP